MEIIHAFILFVNELYCGKDGLIFLLMMKKNQVDEFWRVLDESFQFQYIQGCAGIVKEGGTYDWRSLPCSLIVRVEGGEIKYEFEGMDRPLVLTDEAVLFIPPNAVYKRWREVYAGSTMRVSWMHFQCFVCGGIDPFALMGTPILFECASFERLKHSVVDCIAVNERFVENPSLRMIAGKRRLEMEIVEEVLKYGDSEASFRMFLSKIDRLIPVLRYLDEHLSEPFSRNDLARLMNLSVSRCDKVFKDIMGVAPLDYLIDKRLQAAKVRLLGSFDSISEIAEQVGYDDPYYFSRIFRKRVGQSPRRYRDAILTII